MTPDIINGAFEFAGAAFIGLSVRRVLIDKAVAGISWVHVGFFAVWGLWNLFYYPHLDQWFSFAGGVALAAMNTWCVGLLIWYGRRRG